MEERQLLPPHGRTCAREGIFGTSQRWGREWTHGRSSREPQSPLRTRASARTKDGTEGAKGCGEGPPKVTARINVISIDGAATAKEVVLLTAKASKIRSKFRDVFYYPLFYSTSSDGITANGGDINYEHSPFCEFFRPACMTGFNYKARLREQSDNCTNVYIITVPRANRSY